MNTFWEEIIKFLISSSAISVGVILIVKHLISHLFSKDLERFKSDLEKDVIRYNIMYEKLQSERALVIKNIYVDLVNVERDFSSLIKPFQGAGELTKEEKTKNAINSANAFLKNFEQNRIFFEEDLVGKLDSFKNKVYQIWIDFKYKDDLPQGKERIDQWGIAWKAMEEEIPPIKKTIEDDFRKILGIK